jgi:hypothetical protein
VPVSADRRAVLVVAIAGVGEVGRGEVGLALELPGLRRLLLQGASPLERVVELATQVAHVLTQAPDLLLCHLVNVLQVVVPVPLIGVLAVVAVTRLGVLAAVVMVVPGHRRYSSRQPGSVIGEAGPPHSIAWPGAVTR